MYSGYITILQEVTLGRHVITSGSVIYVAEGDSPGSYYYHDRVKSSAIWGNKIDPKIFRDLYNKGMIKLTHGK